jgi:hypothetical protein
VAIDKRLLRNFTGTAIETYEEEAITVLAACSITSKLARLTQLCYVRYILPPERVSWGNGLEDLGLSAARVKETHIYTGNGALALQSDICD